MRIQKNDKYLTIAYYTVGTIVTIIIIGYLLVHLKDIGRILADTILGVLRLLMPLIIGGIIAYLFDPLVEVYEKRCTKKPFLRKNRVGGATDTRISSRTYAVVLALLTFLCFIGIMGIVIEINMKAVLGNIQLDEIGHSATYYIKAFHKMLMDLNHIANDLPFVRGKVDVPTHLYDGLEKIMVKLGDKFLLSLSEIITGILVFGLSLIIAFYILRDKEKLLIILNRFMMLLIPKKIQNEVKDIGLDVHKVFSGYIRGQLLDAVIMGTLTSIVLTWIGIDFAIIIGVIAGLFNLIPYFGPIVGIVLAGVIGVIGPEPIKGLYAIISVVVIQQIDAWFIVPKVMGETVKLHPIVVLLVILIGGQLFGVVGMLLAIPITGFIRLQIIRYMGDLFSVEK